MKPKAPRGESKKRLIVAMTGATGSIYGLRILEALRAAGGWETHLIVSDPGMLNAWQEYRLERKHVQKLADVVHNVRDVGASIASGSFITAGMVIAPCSMKTLSGVAHAFSDNLITRAADVILKERRRLVLITREAPLNLAHLRNMVAVTEMGGVIFPPVPGVLQPRQNDRRPRQSHRRPRPRSLRRAARLDQPLGGMKHDILKDE